MKDVVLGNNNLKSISTQANVPVSLTTKSRKKSLVFNKKQAKVNKINYGENLINHSVGVKDVVSRREWS